MANKRRIVALVGNPNTGKSTLFNALTGLDQKISNYPGITVEKKVGTANLPNGEKIEVVDLPGTYSFTPTSLDEEVVFNALAHPAKAEKPDLLLCIVDATQIKRNLFLFSQIAELDYPVVLVVNMMDQLEYRGMQLDLEKLEAEVGVKVLGVSAKKKEGLSKLKAVLSEEIPLPSKTFFEVSRYFSWVESAKEMFGFQNSYVNWVKATDEDEENQSLRDFQLAHGIDKKKARTTESIQRYRVINQILSRTFVFDPDKDKSITARLDRFLTHKVFGILTLIGLLFIVFQAIFSWASVPMDFIDAGFANLSEFIAGQMSGGLLSRLITEGIIPGIAGVLIFIPQIAILFLFITLLEEVGYMSRVVVLMDRIMRPFGLSGKSVVPLISGTACSIPAVMAARNIESWKERLVTILVTPFTTCSARLPVYAVLIALVIPETTFFGVNVQGLVLLGLYLLGFAAAVGAGYFASKLIKIKERNVFVVEMPQYKMPVFLNVVNSVWQNAKSFVLNAGKIILAISIVLWVLASFGPGEAFSNAEQIVESSIVEPVSSEQFELLVQEHKLANSYIGILGKAIEPAIQPLGYDWKIGIALITSFAAREIFVGSMSTIYSIGSEVEATVVERLSTQVNPLTGDPVFTLSVGLSLLIFYAFAMQCLSTLAVVKKETGSWKWPLIQLFSMSGLAYISALIVYQIFK